MARNSRSQRSSGRVARRNARTRPAPDQATRYPSLHDFDETWLNRVRENPGIRLVDLMRYEDRRRYNPVTIEKYPKPEAPTARGWLHKPRIVIVPERSRLAKYATYGERYSLSDVWRGKTYRESDYYAESSVYGDKYDVPGRRAYVLHKGVSRRLGFHAPWQVIICVRRKRRREVLHAIRVAGKRGVGRNKTQRRNSYSQVRC